MRFIILFALMCFLSNYISANQANPITIVWQVPMEGYLETDWLQEIFFGIKITSLQDCKFEQYINNSIVVISFFNNTQDLKNYFKKMHELNYKFGIIHLNDEWYKAPTDFYDHAQFVLRNYWHKKFKNNEKIISIPLGYRKGFCKSCDKFKKNDVDTELRKYDWSFAGQIVNKPTRQSMISNMKRIANYFVHETAVWDDPKSLPPDKYQELMLQSYFIPCPTGWGNIDSYRVYEALECGCIPIVETKPLDYFAKFFGNHPFLTIESWDQAPAIINQLLSDKKALNERRVKCLNWWLDYKKNLNTCCTDIIRKTLM